MAQAIQLSGYGIAIRVRFGSPTFLRASETGQAVSVYVSGILRNQYDPITHSGVRMGSTGVSRRAGSKTTATFTIFDDTTGWVPAAWDEVLIYEGSQRSFLGYIQEIQETAENGFPGRHEYRCQCVDAGVLCDRRYVTARYDTMIGGFAGPVIANLTSRFLDGTGIWFDQNEWPVATQIYEQLFNCITMSEALRRLMDIVDGAWWVDEYKQLRTYPKDTGYGSAPVSFADDDGQIYEIQVTSSGRNYANRVGVRNNVGRTNTWTDTWIVGDNGGSLLSPYQGPWMFPTTFAQTVAPIVKVDGVAQTVAQNIGGTIPDCDFYWRSGSYSIWRRWDKSELSDGQVVTIEYPSSGLSYVVWADDEDEQAAHGRQEYVEEVKDYADDASLLALASGILEERKEIPQTISIKTQVPGFRPGQVVSLNLTHPAIVGDFLIDSVETREDASAEIWQTIQASNATKSTIANARAFFDKIIERDRQPLDRVAQHIRFNVAGTIEGITNPGLTADVESGIQTAIRAGILADVRLRFKSVDDGTPTTSEITLSIRQNGVEISQLDFPAGQTGQVIQWQFSSSPQTVAVGDRFGYKVLAADAAAQDGILELNVIG